MGFAGGMDLKRLPEMIKGLRKLRDSPNEKIRRGVSPEQLGKAMPSRLLTPLQIRLLLAISQDPGDLGGPIRNGITPPRTGPLFFDILQLC